ncbi:MAG: patatin-like phospholipase family protein [Bryobacteraceae bacterium]
MPVSELKRPQTALVLSGGGLFGAYQAGAWRILAGRFHPDLVVGASIGAVNGWMIAGGCPQETMERHWLDLAEAGNIRWRRPPHPWRGVMDSAPVGEALRSIQAAYAPRCEYALVVTEMPRMRPRIVRGAEVTWRHLAASCSLPFVFEPVRIGGRLYTDGGLLCANPIWAAAALGARRVIAVNVLDRMPSSILRCGAAALRRIAPFRPFVPASLEVSVLTPSDPLGSVRESLRPDARLVRKWLELGAADAERWEALR